MRAVIYAVSSLVMAPTGLAQELPSTKHPESSDSASTPEDTAPDQQSSANGLIDALPETDPRKKILAEMLANSENYKAKIGVLLAERQRLAEQRKIVQEMNPIKRFTKGLSNEDFDEKSLMKKSLANQVEIENLNEEYDRIKNLNIDMLKLYSLTSSVE